MGGGCYHADCRYRLIFFAFRRDASLSVVARSSDKHILSPIHCPLPGFAPSNPSVLLARYDEPKVPEMLGDNDEWREEVSR